MERKERMVIDPRTLKAGDVVRVKRTDSSIYRLLVISKADPQGGLCRGTEILLQNDQPYGIEWDRVLWEHNFAVEPNMVGVKFVERLVPEDVLEDIEPPVVTMIEGDGTKVEVVPNEAGEEG